MDIGINILRFQQRGHRARYGENRYKKLKEQGFSCVDLGVCNVHTPFFTASQEEADAHLLDEKRMAEESGIKIWQIHGPQHDVVKDGTPEGRAEQLKDMKKAIRSAAIIGVKYMVVHPIMPLGWSDRLMEDNGATLDINIEFYKELTKTAREYDVIVCLENLPCRDFSISIPADVLKIVEGVNDDHFQMCLDIGHVTAFNENHKPEDAIRLLGDKIKVLHVHDNKGKTDQHLFPQYGMINWTEVAKALKEIGFKGVFSLELDFPEGLSDELYDESFKLLVRTVKEIIKDL